MTLTDFLMQKPPGALYHYTSAGGLISIFEHKEIWATSVMHLNDSQEFRHGFDAMLEGLRERMEDGACAPEQRDLLETTYREWKTPGVNTRERMCVVCFSTNGDQLSQWRAYSNGGEGYSIGFRLNDLAYAMKVSSFRLVKCVYDEGEKRTLAQALLDYLFRCWKASERLDLPGSLHLLDRAMQRVLVGILAMKDEGFKEEQEWRLVGRHSEATPLKFRAGRFGVVPYCSLPLCDGQSRPPIDSVYVGPNADSEAAGIALEELLISTMASTSHPTSLAQLPQL